MNVKYKELTHQKERQHPSSAMYAYWITAVFNFGFVRGARILTMNVLQERLINRHGQADRHMKMQPTTSKTLKI